MLFLYVLISLLSSLLLLTTRSVQKRINHFLWPVETPTTALPLQIGSRSFCLSLHKSQPLLSLISLRICFVEDSVWQLYDIFAPSLKILGIILDNLNLLWWFSGSRDAYEVVHSVMQSCTLIKLNSWKQNMLKLQKHPLWGIAAWGIPCIVKLLSQNHCFLLERFPSLGYKSILKQPAKRPVSATYNLSSLLELNTLKPFEKDHLGIEFKKGFCVQAFLPLKRKHQKLQTVVWQPCLNKGLFGLPYWVLHAPALPPLE